MDHDSTDNPKAAVPRKARRGSEPAGNGDLPDPSAADLDPAMATADEDEEARLPEASEVTNEAVAEGPLAVGHAARTSASGCPPMRASTRRSRPASCA